jgi:hypothetical protein
LPMRKKIKIVFIVAGLCLLSFFNTPRAAAAPSEPAQVVNHTTKECSEIATGDECVSCVPAEGWEILIGNCPEGYTVLEQWAPTTCTFYPSGFCCQSRENSDAGCKTIPSPVRNFFLSAILVIVPILGLVVVFLYRRHRSTNE